MGVWQPLKLSDSTDLPKKNSPNPNPFRFEIVRTYEKNGNMLVQINYPDCTNYEGNKILIYKNMGQEITKLDKLDPHFFESRINPSPFMRIKPTEEGWEMGKRIMDLL